MRLIVYEDVGSSACLSTIIHSVVKTILPIEAAFCNVDLVTLAGSIIPMVTEI